MTSSAADIPLCVDLDGTLVRTDLLHEGVLQYARTSPLCLLKFPIWLWEGKASFKEHIGEGVIIDVETLPYRQQVLELIEEAKAHGRRVVLATAATQKVAHAVANHLGVFDEVLCSNGDRNLKSEEKAKALEERFGAFHFDYVGDSSDDIPVLERARHAYLVGNRAGRVSGRVEHRREPVSKARAWLRAVRIHQWLKNLLILVPALAAHRIGDAQVFWSTLLAFLAFSLCASSVYVLNDLLDLTADRRHPSKSKRPFASGILGVADGLRAAAALLFTAFLVAAAIRPEFVVVLGIYYILTSLYSFWLKRQVIVDVMLLAGLYTLRIIAGAAATDIAPSFWLLAFSMFIFLCLALVKRYSELRACADKSQLRGRGYSPSDAQVILSLGTGSGLISALILALYTQAQSVSALYKSPEYLWLAPLLLLHWVARIWMKAQRGEVHDDPVVFAVKDWQSIVTVSLLTSAFAAATLCERLPALWQ